MRKVFVTQPRTRKCDGTMSAATPLPWRDLRASCFPSPATSAVAGHLHLGFRQR
jgi:hypothetical protein